MIKPINDEALTKWVGHIDSDVVKDMAQIAPMLATLGYDPNANPPNYGKADALILTKMEELKSNKEVWDKKQKEINTIREEIRKSLVNVLKKTDKNEDYNDEPKVMVNQSDKR